MSRSVMEKIAAYLEAKREYDEACASCEYDHGYFLHNHRVRLDEAEKEAEAALNDLVTARLREIIGGGSHE